MPARRAASGGFQPVIMFDDRTPSDQLAVQMIYSIMTDVRETMNTERSKQQVIGISEIGMDCRRCVARKLSGLYVKVPDPSWKAQVGTFIHAGMEDHFGQKYLKRRAVFHDGVWKDLTDEQIREVATDENPVFLLERRVHIIDYKSLHLAGSCDMIIIGATFCIVLDWKTQNSEKLRTKTAKGQIGNQYTVQMHTYGLGYEKLGFTVTHVLLYALPRDGELDDSKPVLARYDRDIALGALLIVQNLIDAAEIIGWETVIAAQPRAGFCFDCNRYESQEEDAFMHNLMGGA